MIKVFSYGGGVQSTAALVLAASEKINYKTFLFCNVGEDSEHPDTLKYVHEMAMPYAKEHGIQILELHKQLRDGSIDTIFQHITRPNSRSIGIPVRMSNGAPSNRSCTVDFKVKVVDKWLKTHNAKQEKALIGLGISLDEFTRMRTNTDPDTVAWKSLDYPLIDLRLDRQDCINIIARSGLPIPPKSSCYFCPFHRLSVWQNMRTHQPELFEKAVELERLINMRREEMNKDHVWFSAKLKSLDKATTELEQESLFDEDECSSGYCFL